MAKDIETKSELRIGPITIVNSLTGETEARLEGISIYNLTGDEASSTLQDLAKAILPFNVVTGEPLDAE